MNKEGFVLVGVLVALANIGGLNGEITDWTSPGPGSPTGNGSIEITDRIAEHSIPPGTTIFTATATTNETGAISYSLIENPTGVGKIDPSTGIVSVAEGKTLDFENGETLEFQVVAQDAGRAKGTATITLTLTDVHVTFNQPSYTACVHTNSSVGTHVITVSATEGNNTNLNYIITGGNTGGAFAVAPTSGNITVKQPTADPTTYNLVVQAKASETPPDTANANVTVTIQADCHAQPNSASFFPVSVAVLISALLAQTLQ